MKITLVNPPYPSNAHSHPPFIPLGIAYLGAVCEKAGHEVTVIDCQAERLSFDAFRKRVAQTNAEVVGMTSTTLTYKSALENARIAKEELPNCTTVLGGCHATFWDENALNECPSLDIIVRREGEITFIELLEKLKSKSSLNGVLGVTFRNRDGGITRNEDRPFIENLDDLPFPAHHLLPLSSFHVVGKTIFPLTTSRGCVYWCEFCTAVRMFGRRYRMRSAKNVVDEIEMIYKKYGQDQFTFYDDAFTVDRQRVVDICNEIHRRNLPIHWDCETRVDMVDRDLLQKMHDAGCIAVWFGVESGSQNVLEKMQKKIKLDQTKLAFKTAREIGLMTVASVVLGFPGETEETAWETINFVKELDPDDIGFYIATPYPGTPMYDLVKSKGWLKVTDFNRYDTATPTFETPQLSGAKLKEIRYKAHQQFYLRPGYIIRMFGRGGTYGVSALKTSAAYMLRALHLRLS
ncbi:radical SAM protein [Candidatus Bathyarchaeota archaeon A05DMB-2]|nr:radical SAM protein [Candidatus Bathyarchaeota archaeon A05DMB-2]